MRNRHFILFGIAIVFTALTFVSCLDEPTIPQPSQQFAVLRVGNFSPNVATMNVKVDGKTLDASMTGLATNDVSNYVTLNSGSKLVFVTNAVTGDTLFNKKVEVTTNNVTSLFFLGEYSKVDTLNTFQNLEYYEGLTYVSHTPASGKANIYFINLITTGLTPLPAVESQVVDFRDVTVTPTWKTDSLVAIDIATREAYSTANSLPVGRRFAITVANKPATKLASDSVAVAAGKNYFVFAVGNAKGPKVVIPAPKNSIPYLPR